MIIIFLYRCGLLDSIGQSTIDLVDRIVFDSSSSLRVRGEALAFMMDHTEGFDEIDQNEIEDTTNENSIKKKGRRNSKSKSQTLSQETNEVKALAKKKRLMFQLETLAEFADYHLKLSDGSNNNLIYINLLSEACLLKRPSN